MALVKTCAAVLALALFLQSGCDLWCRHAEEATSAAEPVPSCHDTGDRDSDPDAPRDHETSTECVHPRAVDENSRLQAKVVKANEPIAIVEVADDVQLHVRWSAVLYRMTVLDRIGLHRPSSAILRI